MWCNRQELFEHHLGRPAASMASDKDKGSTYTITPFSGTPGQDWEDFEDELYNALALKTDERGSSLADTLEGNDEGGAHGAQFPAGADGQKALRLRNGDTLR